MNDFAKVNALYSEFFGNHKPARSAVEVARLPKDVLVEMEAVVRYFSSIFAANPSSHSNVLSAASHKIPDLRRKIWTLRCHV